MMWIKDIAVDPPRWPLMHDSLSSELVSRYAQSWVPRYTSYPTAPHFTADVSEAHYRSWLSSLPAVRASLYLHIPFCRAMCWYCGCHTTVAAREAPIARYLDCLDREIELVASLAAGPLSIGHIHFGGGTPTLIPRDRLRSMMSRLRELYALTDDVEIAIEIDPRTLSVEMAEALGESGFTRASLGVQSFDLTVQKAINRVQSFEETERAVRALRANGIAGINFDLIYGLPHQSLQSCLATVDQALELRPDRLAVFGYAHVPAFKPHQRKIDTDALAGPAERFAHSREIARALTSEGYVEIGLDHFALPHDPLAQAASSGRLHRNFQGYTTDDSEVLIGLGASAIGRMPQGYVQNEVRLPRYEQLIGEGKLPVVRGYRYKSDDRPRGEIIERLMCDQQADVARICTQFGADPAPILDDAPLGALSADGLIDFDGSKVTVKAHARPLVRSIAAAFDSYLDRGGDRYSRAV